MQALEVYENLKKRKGQHVKIVWQRTAKIFAEAIAAGHVVFKRTEAFVRSGISYANLADIRNAVESGQREPVEGLPFGVWREGFENFIIDNGETEYIRLYPASFDNLDKARKVTWLLDGKEVSYETVEPFLLASEKHKPEDRPPTFTVKAADILNISSVRHRRTA